MGNDNVAEVTSLQSVIYLKFGKSPEQVYLPGLHAFSKVWLKLNENCGQQPFENVNIRILQSAPNDLN